MHSRPSGCSPRRSAPGSRPTPGRRRTPRRPARPRLIRDDASGSSHPDPGADPAYAALKARIIARTGHHYYIDKDDLLIERLRRRFRDAAAADCAAYAALLSDGALGEAEWARLEAEITVGETFFFRYAEQFQALRERILPALIAARASERTLRIWSAGCSTGAEPYSLAILVRELLGEALPDWRISILGTDISTDALATARAAEYGRWALRTMPLEERLRYFTRLPPAPGIRREGGYALRPEFRALVRFERGNLLTLTEPAAAAGEAFDLILCRNVLIYFEARTVAAVVRGLGRRLRPDGWLLLGHAEPNPVFSGFLDAVSLPGTVVYRPLPEPPALVMASGLVPPSLGVGGGDGAEVLVPDGPESDTVAPAAAPVGMPAADTAGGALADLLSARLALPLPLPCRFPCRFPCRARPRTARRSGRPTATASGPSRMPGIPERPGGRCASPSKPPPPTRPCASTRVCSPGRSAATWRPSGHCGRPCISTGAS